MKRRAGAGSSSGDEKLSAAVTLGLFAAWALHDTEEPLTAPRWIRDHVPQLRERWPELPERVRRVRKGIDERELRAAVAVMAGIVGAGAASGRASGGRGAVCQAMLNAFGPHGRVHLGQAVACRGRTPASRPPRPSSCRSPRGRGTGSRAPGCRARRGAGTSSLGSSGRGRRRFSRTGSRGASSGRVPDRRPRDRPSGSTQ
ncbi:HXXEE domain-containing protein [Streptomyces sp. Q6]|uniref:HXXEE domain-containing protein n=1 Tax=Streptomyces citrinus TaxID=3118173 RepID=A0ACD5AIQ4_9ACTN